MLVPHGTALAVVDGTKFELYRNGGTDFEPRLDALETPELQETNYSAGARLGDDHSRHAARTGDGSNDAVDESAHAIAVADWLNREVLQHRIDKLVVVADPRSLGEMRKRYHKELKTVLLAELAKNMTGRPALEIVNALKS